LPHSSEGRYWRHVKRQQHHEPGCLTRLPQWLAWAGSSAEEVANLIRSLGPRWFRVSDVHATPNMALLNRRWAMSFLRAPRTWEHPARAGGFAAAIAAWRHPIERGTLPTHRGGDDERPIRNQSQW
jgi:hypothetical protein